MDTGMEPRWIRVSFILGIFLAISLNSAFAQNGWKDYHERWQERPDSDRMFPFGEDFMDIKHDSDLGFDARIAFEIQYAGRRYTHIWVDPSGYVELFINATVVTRSPLAPTTVFPNQYYPVQADPPIIAPYFAPAELQLWRDLGRIYWRTLSVDDFKGDEDRREITREMLDWVSLDVRENVLGAELFRATHGIIVTWEDVTYPGCNLGTNQCPTNTYQMVIVTDGRDSHTIFNYYDLNWVGSFGQNCNPTTGANCIPAQAGFNRGSARGFDALPLSGTTDVVRLDEQTATGVSGRFVYHITGGRVRRGGCSTDTNIDQERWPVEVYPKLGDMLGGYPVYVSGPCFRQTDNIRIIIGDTQVEATIPPGERDTNRAVRAEIIMPYMDTVGDLDVIISPNGGLSFSNLKEKFPVVPYHRARPSVRLDNDHGEWFTRRPQTLGFHWCPKSMMNFWEKWRNTTRAEELRVNIYLMGYFERADSLKGEWKELQVLGENVPNTGDFQFNVEDHKCTEDCNFGLPLPVGFIRIVRVDNDRAQQWWRYEKSKPFPVGWYINDYMEEERGENWAQEVCQEWYDIDIDWGIDAVEGHWRDELEPCPTTMSHAHADVGRFLYGADCEDDENVEICITNIDRHILGAECREGVPCPRRRCFHQAMSGPSGAASTCCYDKDNGNLLFSGDNRATSPSNRQSAEGLPPMIPPPIEPHMGLGIPSLSHWVWDSMMKVVCCNYTEGESDQYCKRRHDLARPTPDIELYKPPKYAISYGDPHFETFDGNEYTFNGRGEYWLVKVRDMDDHADNFNLQARLVQPEEQVFEPGLPEFEVKATVITAFVMQEGTNPNDEFIKVEMHINYKMPNKKILTLVDGEIMDFGQPELMEREFYSKPTGRRVRIHVNDPPNDNRQSNITVSFESGVGVQISNQNEVLNAIVVLPDDYFARTHGLYGHWDDNHLNDFINRQGQLIDHTEGFEHLHHNFGETWVINEQESRFHYIAMMDWDWFRDGDFIPNWEVPELPEWPTGVTEEDVYNLCRENFVCTYDYKTTLHSGLAAMTLEMEQWMREVDELTRPMPACGRLSPRMSESQFDHYLAGGQVRFTGCAEGYAMRGHTEYECVLHEDNTTTWEPYPNIQCVSPAELQQEQTQMAVMIAVPIIVGALVIAIAVAVFMIYRNKKRKAANEKTPQQPPGNVNNSSLGGTVSMIPFPQTEVKTQGLAGQAEVAGVASIASSRTATPEPSPATSSYYKSPHQVSTFTNPAMIKDTSYSRGSQDSIDVILQDRPALNGSGSPSFSMATPAHAEKPTPTRGSGSNISGQGSYTSRQGSHVSGQGSHVSGSGLAGAGVAYDNGAMTGDGGRPAQFHTTRGEPSVWRPPPTYTGTDSEV